MSQARPAPAGTKRTGWIAIAVVFVVLLVVLGAVGFTVLRGVWSNESAVTGQAGPDVPGGAATASATASAGGCLDDTAAFRVFAGSRPDTQAAVLERVTLVCWEPDGALRAEATYPGDINATSAPMTWLCRTFSGFVTDSGRPWHGFTVYSTNPVTPGKAFLTARTAGGACDNPLHRAGG